MCAKSSKTQKKSREQVLSFPLAVRSEQNSKIIRTLLYLQGASRKYLRDLYREEILDSLSDTRRKAYKILEPDTPKRWKARLPSRVNRGVLEICGRILRTVNKRRELFNLLVQTFGLRPHGWSYRKLITKQQVYTKSQYIANLAEQVENFFLTRGEYPESFFDFQTAPSLHKPILSYAPDDGQAIRMIHRADHLDISLKVIAYGSSKSKPQWQWTQIRLPLPHFLQPYSPLAPDLRLANIHGCLLPVLDYKIRLPCADKKKSPYFLTVDWGTRKLLTICVFDRQGNQICPPIFLQFDPLERKLLRIRKEIDHLKAQRDRLPEYSSGWTKYNREIAKRWRKYRAVQAQLAHLASNVIVLIAQIYGCSEIYVEWLKSLKSWKFSPTLNWIINTTVRQAIYDKVLYKANLLGIELKRPVQPYGTSQYCPRCGKKGFHTKSPNHTQPIKSGGWFVCPDCHYNADRDYVACCNLARKVLYGNLRDLCKGIAYTASPISDSLFRQSKLPRERLHRNVGGWKEVISLQPQRFFCGTLRY